jgi:prephenate dehydrogenase (NADP+)
MKIGIIGLGDMGKLYAKKWAESNYEVYGCDLPERQSSLQKSFDEEGIIVTVLKDGIQLSRLCDMILYCVETTNIEAVVKQFGPSTKYGAIVGGQTSVKTPEYQAFKKHLPADATIISNHALFGPHVNTENQTQILININASSSVYDEITTVYKAIGAKIEHLDSVEEHDKLMSDIQAVTHIGFESIGTACMHRKDYPWKNSLHPNGLDNLKYLLTLRVYSYKAHVYAGLALQNPYAKLDVRTYAEQENELFSLMITGNRDKYEKKVRGAIERVFRDKSSENLFDESLMNHVSLNKNKDSLPNSHLSLLSMLCTWDELNINPYKNLICQTPPFKLRVGMVEYLCNNEDLLNETINAAITNLQIRADDLAFHTAVHEWSHIIEAGNEKNYYHLFEKTKGYLEPDLERGRLISGQIISQLN